MELMTLGMNVPLTRRNLIQANADVGIADVDRDQDGTLRLR